MAAHAVALARAPAAARAHGDDQGPLRRLHDHHAQPHRVPTRSDADLAARAVQLLDKTDAGRRPVRLLGVSVHNFCGDAELIGQSDRLPLGTRDPADGATDTEETPGYTWATEEMREWLHPWQKFW